MIKLDFFFLFYLRVLIFFFQDPSSKDGGVYKCNIKNDEGEINANLNLNIEGNILHKSIYFIFFIILSFCVTLILSNVL